MLLSIKGFAEVQSQLAWGFCGPDGVKWEGSVCLRLVALPSGKFYCVPLAYLSTGWEDNCNVVLEWIADSLPLDAQITLEKKWQRKTIQSLYQHFRRSFFAASSKQRYLSALREWVNQICFHCLCAAPRMGVGHRVCPSTVNIVSRGVLSLLRRIVWLLLSQFSPTNRRHLGFKMLWASRIISGDIGHFQLTG